ncbi:glycoside hydrolase family 3 protein [Acetanaerobacterium elongatum]|uniref:beta-glucosidase n=1 Tax=Acetanaerobacterium elongatum TaxID=258515 RepID=A0A1H0D4A7_9FIRM|nr:glycoside hydrolase family 3 protein [Acetanaerobacterium elongatum]SDN64741.1 beta-glucosidase [Acetanaerobacterium elongatum]
MKKSFALLLSVVFCLSLFACSAPNTPDALPSSQTTTESAACETLAASSLPAGDSIEERVDEVMARMTLEDKIGQMVQGEQYAANASEMQKYGLGSVLSGGGSVPGGINTIENWQKTIDGLQKAALSRKTQIPFLYGIDSVHGHNTLYGAVVFPQNVGLGAANDVDLMYKMGCAVAEEMKLTKTLWSFGPCVAVAQDPRWGRTYESLSSNPDIVSALSASYVKGLQEHGVIACAKHFLADGGAQYGTGEGDNLIDRGDCTISEDELMKLHMKPYKAAIDAGAKTVMASFSSFHGVKMHENKHLLTEVLKGQMGFKGFVVSDWEATKGLSGSTIEENYILAVNAGVDMLMEPYDYAKVIKTLTEAVKSGAITEERVNDACRRILTVKMESGIFDDPYQEKLTHEVDKLGSEQYRSLAKTLVEKSLVLLKNEGNVLPLKKGQKVFLTGPALEDIGVQCGGWTITWQGETDAKVGGKLTEGTTILEGFKEYASAYNLELITDKNKAKDADVVVLALGETPYAEFNGDTEDLSITGKLALAGNKDAIGFVKGLNKPTVSLLVTGRNVIISDYMADWDATVACYLPGTEGDGIASVLVGETPFTGKLAMPWYQSVGDIGSKDKKPMFELGYGLTYQK